MDNIFRLRQFLSKNRDAYVDVALNRDHSISGLTDLERDKIDAGKFPENVVLKLAPHNTVGIRLLYASGIQMAKISLIAKWFVN